MNKTFKSFQISKAELNKAKFSKKNACISRTDGAIRLEFKNDIDMKIFEDKFNFCLEGFLKLKLNWKKKILTKASKNTLNT